MNRHTTTVALLSLVASAGAAHAQVFIPMNAPGKNYNETRTNDTGKGIVSFSGFDDNGNPVAGLWDWRTDDVVQMPALFDDFGQVLPFEPLQLRTTAERGPNDPVKGISIGLIKIVPPKAMIWDASDGAPGTVYELPNGFGLDSWATSASTDAGIIAGALGDDVSRYAAIWTNAGFAEFLPVPVGTNASEIWDVSPSGDTGVGFAAIGTQGMSSSNGTKLKPTTSSLQKGIIWNLNDGSIQEVDPAAAGAQSLVLSALSADGSSALTWAAYADDSTKAGLYDMASQSYTPLDAGDINGDGQVNLADRHDSAAYALSDNGSVIGGSYTLPGGQETAAFWSAATGYQMQDLLSYLSTEGASNLAGWHLTSITGISENGTLFSGSGFNPAGEADVWVAIIPTPTTGTLLALSGLLAARRSRR